MNDKITEGTYRTKPVGWGLSESKAGNPMIYVNFDIDLTWYASLASEKSKKYVAQALVLMGFKGQKLEDIDGTTALDKTKEILIVVKVDPDYGPKIKYINDPDKQMGGLTKDEFNQKHGQVDLSGALAAARQDAGMKSEKNVETDIDF